MIEQAKLFRGYFLHHFLHFLCEKHLILNDATLTVKNHPFYHKIQNFFNLIFLQHIYHQCLKLYESSCNISVLSRFIRLYPQQKSVYFQKLRLLENRYFTPLCMKHQLQL